MQLREKPRTEECPDCGAICRFGDGCECGRIPCGASCTGKHCGGLCHPPKDENDP